MTMKNIRWLAVLVVVNLAIILAFAMLRRPAHPGPVPAPAEPSAAAVAKAHPMESAADRPTTAESANQPAGQNKEDSFPSFLGPEATKLGPGEPARLVFQAVNLSGPGRPPNPNLVEAIAWVKQLPDGTTKKLVLHAIAARWLSTTATGSTIQPCNGG